MMTRFALGLAVAASGMLALTTARAAEEKKDAELHCVVSGKKADKANHVAYKEGEVYFCCQNCPKAFAKDTAKFATKANHQLVFTHQYEQKKCPISGQALNPEHKTEIAGIEVGYCCPNCKGKVEKAEGDDAKLALVFADKPFDKAFVKKEKEEKKPE